MDTKKFARLCPKYISPQKNAIWGQQDITVNLTPLNLLHASQTDVVVVQLIYFPLFYLIPSSVYYLVPLAFIVEMPHTLFCLESYSNAKTLVTSSQSLSIP